jgi:hypothetical protein
MQKSIAYFLLIALLSLNFNFGYADEPDAKEKLKIELGKQKLYGGQYKAALKIFQEVLANHPENGNVLFYVGLTFYQLKEFDQAQNTLEKAAASKETNKETFYYLGLIYQSNGKFDESIQAFTNFKGKITDKENMNEYFIDNYLSQLNNAKSMVTRPVDAKIENMGNTINSNFDDKSPCVSADGLKMVFTSRRPATTDAPMDIEGDGGYFEDIFLCHWDTVKHDWGHPESLHGINTDAHDAVRSISPDGKTIFIYKNDLNGESRGGDIYVSKVNGSKWKEPESINKAFNCSVNSTYWEDGACISPDGKHLYFVSESPKYGKEKGFGGGDIWVIDRISKTEWSKPRNLGPEVNTPYQEVGIFLAPDGKTLFFCSNSPASMGDYDVFKTTLENGKWSKPVNLGFPVNSERKDGPFTLSANHTIAYVSSERSGGLGGADLYRINLTNYPLLEEDMKKSETSGLSILKGSVMDGFQGTRMEGVEIIISDETGTNVISTLITDGNGDYFITLKGDTKYKMSIQKKGFKKIEVSVELLSGKNGRPFSLEKQFLLDKEK